MISFEDWTRDPVGSIMKMGEGNPGGIRVASDLMNYRADEDFRGLLALMNADDLGIRGSKLWVAYKDLCDQDIVKLADRLNARDLAALEEKNEAPRD